VDGCWVGGWVGGKRVACCLSAWQFLSFAESEREWRIVLACEDEVSVKQSATQPASHFITWRIHEKLLSLARSLSCSQSSKAAYTP